MSADAQPAFPGWDAMYQQRAPDSMPCFYPELDELSRQLGWKLPLCSKAF